MKKIFKKEEILSNKGCYSREQVLNLSFINNREITLINIMKSEISIQDKRWFLYNKGELSTNQKKVLALKLAWAVLPIYEDQYPGDNRVRDCLQDIEKFNLDNIFFNELAVKRNATEAAAAAAYAAAAYAADAYAVTAAAYAATAAAEAAATAADAAAADSYAATAATYAATAAAYAAYAAAYAADAYADAAAAAADVAADAAADAAAEVVVFKSITYSNKLQQIIIDFIINNE